jgi:hypothetical protein
MRLILDAFLWNLDAPAKQGTKVLREATLLELRPLLLVKNEKQIRYVITIL